MCLEHQLEGVHICQVNLAVWAFNLVFLDKFGQRFVCVVWELVRVRIGFCPFFYEMVGSMSFVTKTAFGNWVREVLHMLRRDKNLWMRQDGCINRYTLCSARKKFPPQILYVSFQGAKRTVVVAVGEAVIRFEALVDEPAPLAKV
eukprot:34877_2